MNEEQEMQSHTQEQSAKSQNDDRRELDLMEMEIFRQHWRSLNAALAEIRELRGADSLEVDPVEFVKHEVANLKNQFSELKEMIAGLQNQQAPQQIPQQTIPRFQQMQPAVPILPYYSTPNFAPMIPINQQ